ncbi:hypothetical protein GGTG_01383 [Gaeumannomyces tritici R3-111a-1]|uniref:Anaphase-promoting complex subunit 4 n=1 Tax=Gaeumannomyces tritici (strain R3-111a-1) TaxID=644352 RepID=J3NJF2_GAET3|nr:hypothetical protein GGTG_01383 [Gaeumannomyces tritici R3-111a-1]EJT81403.1 hypothetical protein GGTG_01383 [Gaeumannomyces tritici R3-111a-1]
MTPRQSLKLQIYSSGSLPAPVLPGKLACSPMLDLLATADNDNSFFIRRANAEQVSKPAQIPGAEILAVRWKPDGQYVAVAWSDGVVRLTGIESTKALHQISPRESPQAKVEYLGWTRNWTGKAHTRLAKSARSAALADLVPGVLDGVAPDERSDMLDLPREVTFLDVETSLPKLSPLPVSGGTGEDTFVFSSRTSLEFVFKAFKAEEADQVDIMIAGMVDGSMRLTIYDTFDVGLFRYALPSSTHDANGPRPLRLVCHGSHPAVSSHFLLLRAGDDTPEMLYLVPMDLRFVCSSHINLSLLASKVTILQKILRYIHQTQVHMAAEWASARDLPARFLRNVSEDLAQSKEGPKSVIQALYHTVLTGHAHPITKDWLVDSVAERGHKRWDKAVTSGLGNIRALIHENMLPALDRCAIILSRLLGLARFHDGSRSDVGLSAAKISRLLEIISCLILACHKVLVHVMNELELFGMFSSWLRFQIDRLASSASSAADDLTEREATMDNGKVLEYISRFLTQSPAAMFFGPLDPEAFREDEALADGGPPPLLDAVEAQIRLAENGEPHMQALPRIDFLVWYLKGKAQGVFDDIAEAERRSVRFGSPTALAVGGPVSKQEISVCSLPKDDGVDAQTYTVLSRRDQEGALYIFRTKITMLDGMSTEITTDACALALTEGKLVDFKFLNEDALIVLWQPEEKGASPFMFRLSLESQKARFSGYTDGTPPTAHEVSVGDLMAGSPRMDVSGGGGAASGRGAFRPVWMEVKRPSSGRGRMPSRVCLLGSDKVTYKVFAVPDDLEGRADAA